MVVNVNVNVICLCILLVISYLLYYYYVNTSGYTEEFYNNDNYFDLKYDTPTGHNMEKMVCSKSCCSTQWPTSEPTQIKDLKINMNEYLPTNLNCNDGIHDTGCMCKKKTI
jgi:hypothetical protein